MNRGLPVVVPPEPALMLGQTRTTTPASPVQLAESVAVMSNAVFSVRSTVPKLRFVIVNPQLMGAACVGDGQAKTAAPARVQSANCRTDDLELIGSQLVRRALGSRVQR